MSFVLELIYILPKLTPPPFNVTLLGLPNYRLTCFNFGSLFLTLDRMVSKIQLTLTNSLLNGEDEQHCSQNVYETVQLLDTVKVYSAS